MMRYNVVNVALVIWLAQDFPTRHKSLTPPPGHCYNQHLVIDVGQGEEEVERPDLYQ